MAEFAQPVVSRFKIHFIFYFFENTFLHLMVDFNIEMLCSVSVCVGLFFRVMMCLVLTWMSFYTELMLTKFLIGQGLVAYADRSCPAFQ